MPLLRTYKRFDETTLTRTSSIKAKDKIVCNGSPLNTEGLTDTARKSMYTSSVMIPAILFLSSSCCFALYIFWARQRSTPYRSRKENSWRRLDSNLKKEEIR